jgi:AAA domain
MQFTDSNKASTIMRATSGIKFEFLVETLIERAAVGMIVAPAKAKKSMMAMNLVYSLITKKPFLGLTVSPKPEKIVYVNLELTRHALGVRLKTMNKFYEATPKQLENVLFININEFCGEEALVDSKTQKVNKEPFRKLTEEAKKWGATAVIFDPLYYVVGEENDNVLMAAVIREFGKIRDELNAAVFVIHHTGKSKSDWADPFLVGRGASAIGGAFEFVLGIEPNGDNTAKLHHGSRNYESVMPLSMRFDKNTLTWHSANEKSSIETLDKIMTGVDEMSLEEFYKKSELSKKKADDLLKGCKLYVRTGGHRGKKSTVKRQM